MTCRRKTRHPVSWHPFSDTGTGCAAVWYAGTGIGVYRPNDNPLIDWLQTRGRLRSNKSMLDRKDLKGMIKALKKAKWSGTHRIMITARAQAFSSRCLPLSRLRPRPEHGCWHGCPAHVWCPSFHAVSRWQRVSVDYTAARVFSAAG